MMRHYIVSLLKGMVNVLLQLSIYLQLDHIALADQRGECCIYQVTMLKLKLPDT